MVWAEPGICALIALTIMGAADTVSTVIRNTIRQLQTPDHIRGRMTSVNQIFFMGGPPARGGRSGSRIPFWRAVCHRQRWNRMSSRNVSRYLEVAPTHFV
ncbi:MAG: hypothetical protein U0X93_00960 [Anaerolineales bacterium]